MRISVTLFLAVFVIGIIDSFALSAPNPLIRGRQDPAGPFPGNTILSVVPPVDRWPVPEIIIRRTELPPPFVFRMATALRKIIECAIRIDNESIVTPLPAARRHVVFPRI